MGRIVRVALTSMVALALTMSGMAAAHPDHPEHAESDGGMTPRQKVYGHQHGGEEGHLAPSSSHVELVGSLRVRDAKPGRIADVAAKGNFAYLGAFWEPDCLNGGVYVVDISDASNPREVGFIHTAPDTYVGEGVQVLPIDTAHFKGDVLVHNNEICGSSPAAQGGVTLVDVTSPRRPSYLARGVGDFDIHGSRANESHSAFGWQDGSNAYVIMVDNEEPEDVDILDITDPANPRLIAEYDLDLFDIMQPDVNGQTSFHHDVVVKEIEGRQIALVSYWDGGYVQLDVTDPANATFISDTDFTNPDPERKKHRHTITPEGNAHQAEFTHDDRFFIAADEDFDPFRTNMSITSGPYAGHEFTGTQGTDVPQIDDDTSLVGGTAFVGLACNGTTLPTAAQTGARIAVVERGTCTFTEKATNVSAAGYEGGIVFNSATGCNELVTMLVEGDIPFLFVARKDGLRILNSSTPDDCATAAPATGSAGADVSITGEFDGWGYVHLYDRKTLREVGTYAIPESQDVSFARGYGDLSVHEVATDPDTNLAYFSYYAGGFRVTRYGPSGLREVGHYIAEGGNNFWGVEVHDHSDGNRYVLASDRDSGLWIFRYSGD